MPAPNRKNVYVIGLDAFNRQQLEALPGAERYRVCELLSDTELKSYGDVPFGDTLSLAEERLKSAEDPADALITWWDFPATSLLAILTSRFELPGPSLESTLKCEHKYWSRCVQREVAPKAVPAFCSVNPFDAPAFDALEVEPPFWLKPVKATDSMLGFHIKSQADYAEALKHIREDIGIIAEPFNEILGYADLPDSIQAIDGHHCIAEAILEGSQHTTTGYVRKGEATVYGVVDSINYPDSSSFFRYEYPSALDEGVCERMADVSRRLMKHLGLDDSAFNIEFFYDSKNDRISILEINPRISQSHSDVFNKVDGKSDEGLIVELALDEDPDFPSRQGEFSYAAKFYYRRFEDGLVRRVPEQETIAAIRKEHPHTLIDIEAEEGKRLSDLWEQDSYSYALAILFLGADSREELIHKYEGITRQLPFEIQ